MGRRLLIGVLFGVVVYVGIVLWIDLDNLRSALEGIPLWPIAACAALSFLNYVIRFAKWQRYLALLDIRVPRTTSFLIYLSGFSMGVTPGKMGEVVKSWMLRRVSGVRIHQSAPIVVAERITDLLGYLILVAIGGLASHPEYQWAFWATLGGCAVAIALVGSRRVAHLVVRTLKRTPFLWRFGPRVEGSFQSTRILLRPREVVVPTLVSVASWSCECLGFWLVANAFLDEPLSFLFAVFAYAISAVLGAVAIVVPGGLGVTEWSLGALLRREYEAVAGFSLELARSKAVGAVLLTRAGTLWFGVAVGLVATAIFERRHGHIDVSKAED